MNVIDCPTKMEADVGEIETVNCSYVVILNFSFWVLGIKFLFKVKL